jgi:hypothetical protein
MKIPPLQAEIQARKYFSLHVKCPYVLSKCKELHNKPMTEVHPGHMLTGLKEEEEMQGNITFVENVCNIPHVHLHKNSSTGSQDVSDFILWSLGIKCPYYCPIARNLIMFVGNVCMTQGLSFHERPNSVSQGAGKTYIFCVQFM